MYEQRRTRVPAPRVGLGAFGIGMGVSFVAGGIAVSLLVGGHGPLAPTPGTTGALPQAGAPAVASPTMHRELLADDFGPATQAATTAAAPRPLHRELLADDFGPATQAATQARTPTLHRELLADDFAPSPASN